MTYDNDAHMDDRCSPNLHDWTYKNVCARCGINAQQVIHDLMKALDDTRTERAQVTEEHKLMRKDRDHWRHEAKRHEENARDSRVTLNGFVDIMRSEGHTDLTAGQLIGMVEAVRKAGR